MMIGLVTKTQQMLNAMRPSSWNLGKGRRRKHRTSHDKGVPYEFETAEQLLADFFQAMDSIIKGEAR